MKHPTVIYDGDCSFCKRSVGTLRALVRRPFDAVPGDSPEAAELAPQLTREDLAARMYFVTEHATYGGAEAFARALMLNPLWRLVAWIYYVPGIRQLADAGYRWVAANRGCLGGACEWRAKGA